MLINEAPRNKMHSVEAARGLAALAVVLLHAGSMMSPEQYSGKVGLNGFFNFGKYGVDFFFVLSGFIIYHSSRERIASRRGMPEFLLRRLFRILPAYWATLLLALMANQFQREKPDYSWNFFIEQITLTGNPLWIGPAWTLQFELLFYFVFSLGFVSLRALGAAGIAWSALIVYRALTSGGAEHSNFGAIISNPYCILFLTGLLFGKYHAAGRKVFPLEYTLGISLTAFGATSESLTSELLFRTGIGLIFGSTLLTAVKFEELGMSVPRCMSFLGRISYSLYISHVLIVGLTYAVFSRLGYYGKLGEPVLTLIAVGASLALATLMHRLVEVPGISTGRRFERAISEIRKA